MSIDDQSSHWSNRWIWILVPCICTLLPFSTPIRLGEMAGSGPDVVSSVWAMWWFQEASLLEVLGGKSTLFNFPWGGSGTILSPSSAIVWGVLYTVFGPAWATTLCNLWLINATMLSLVWLGRSFGFSRLACGAMAIMCILPRYMVFTLGETGVVGVAALPLILGLVALKKMEMSTDWRWMIVLIGCIGFQAIENPYLVLVLPLAVLLSALYFRNRRYWISLVFGSIGMLATIWLFRQSSGSYESIRPSGFTELFGLYFPAVEREWARSSLLDMINPIRVLWPAGSMDSIHIQGREYLGCAGIIAAVYGLRDKSMWIWGAFSILGLVLVTGSDWGGLPSPFGLLNSLANAVVRPFTQPSRYFILFIIGASVLVGRSVHHHRWGHWIWQDCCWKV